MLPTTMRAAAIDRFGPPRVLKVRRVPVPQPDPGEVLIALHDAGVGSWDAKIRSGAWATGDERFPLVIGTDGAGFIAAKGSRVRRLDVGDRVWAYEWGNPKGGFYAEYVAVDADHVGHIPRHLDLDEAGASATTGLTALQGIDDILRVRRGETVLVFGASGGVGTLAVQFARWRRAQVLGTATGRAAATLVRRLGAHAVFDARSAEASERLEDLAPDGVDAVLALAGGDTLERCLDHVRSGGTVAYPNGVEPPPRRRRRFSVIPYDAVPGRREFERLEAAVQAARLTIPIAGKYPLGRAAAAHERLERGKVLGRLVLQVRRSNRP
jgi:NADPH:quinone reductase-like Zn-dependent oxidoreductase